MRLKSGVSGLVKTSEAVFFCLEFTMKNDWFIREVTDNFLTNSIQFMAH